ncbi:hypothetical protein TTHERM_01220440 (macronuclear) [Tetrahymena thermophila SB210]|uniref:Uncharacterized protein n=1 Tax=Tetrahymena thermophila (strain SB210) TaxID=312017 RepID=Q24CK5_TETTS|nr:hypothetical protein TTHERM_01220440 [Tetrahymena thermophila SB210]EAS05524.2 hypothetical protein TTHERM_01220440 [Tetrahymena thermophila SB210]|eukprot:XP_001025769.2 hypothetical protein TTHERM_01220440 [Tetrahymena thermophila SB210]
MRDNYLTEQALQQKNQQENSSSRADKLSSQNLDHSQSNLNYKTQRTKSTDQNKSVIQLNDTQRLLELSQNQNQIYQQKQSQLQQQAVNTQSNLINSKMSLLERLEDEFPENENMKKDDKSQIFYTAINQVRHIQSFTKKISQVFNKKQQDIFIKLREDLEMLMQQFDEKVVETLNKKEYELLKSFQITLDKMTKELQECQQKLNDFNLQVELDIKVIGLEKQLRFYRENSYSLNEENKILKEEVSKLKHLYNELEQENLWSRQAHLRTQQKLNVIKEQNNYENQNSTKHSFIQKINNRQNELDTSNLQQDSAHNTLDNIDGVRNSKPSRQFKYRDSLIAARKVIFLQENVHQAANVIDQLLIEKINPRDQLIEQLKEQINNQKMLNKSLSMQIKTSSTPNTTENQIKQLFIKSVSEVQNEIQKRNKMLNTFNPNLDQIEVQKFTKFDRIEVISKFFSSLKFLEIIKTMIFDQKCCNNPKCKFNVNEASKNEEIQINENLDSQQQNNTTQQPGTETNIKAEVSHYDYFDLIKTSQQDENNMNQTNLLPPQSQESTLKKSIEDGQQFNLNRLYQIKHRTNISYYHPQINQNQSAIQYKKNRSNSHSSTAYSGYQLGFSDAQSTNLNTNRDQTYRSFGNTNQFYQVLNQSFEGNLNEKGNTNGNQSNNSFVNQFNGYHKQLKQNISKQKQNQLEINNMHRKFHRYRKEVDNSKPQIETQISDLINNLTSQSKLNATTNSNIQNSEYITVKEKEDKVIFKHNKLY